jgi:hypothetical protein
MDYPQGKWTPHLIEPHWPHGASTDAAVAAARNRGNVQLQYENYGIDLANARNGPLSEQEGEAADAARSAFLNGERHAIGVAERNGVKKKAYETAANAFESLRQALTGVAARGNAAIDEILTSKGGLEKVGKVAHVISESQMYSARASMQCVDQLKGALQDILTAQGDGRSPDQWAKDHGINLTPPAAPNEQAVAKQAKHLLDSQNPHSAAAAIRKGTELPSGSAAGGASSSGETGNLNTMRSPVSGGIEDKLVGSTNPRQSVAPPNTLRSLVQPGSELPPSNVPGASSGAPSAATPFSPITGGGPGAPGLAGGGSGASSSGGALGSPHATGSPSLSSPVSGSQALTPDGLANSFNQGAQSGAPVSAGSEALSQGISQAAAQSPVTHQPIAPPPSTTPSSGSVYSFDAPQTYSHDVGPSYPPPADTASPIYAAPAAPMAPSPAAAMPAAPAGPLPAYGSDLRPPPIAPAAQASVIPAAASPLSATVQPSSAQSALGQPAVVKQQPPAPAAPVSGAGFTERAIAATATGAIAGAAAEQSAAQTRLQSLVEFVARQEPKLRWAVGDREDGSTILVTDLASGWIPPHIEIPSGVRLLSPARRRMNFDALLSDTTNTATWTPGHYLPPEKDAAPIPTSFRARQVPDIDELNWELAQATNWRDGLPRLAHTLAKAGAAGTGVLDSETALLHEHLAAISQKILRAYPDNDVADVGNWQLLAAIDALLTNQRMILNYHFAWFQALSMANYGGAR